MSVMYPVVRWDTGMPSDGPDEEAARERALAEIEYPLREALACLEQAKLDYEAEYQASTGSDEVELPDELDGALRDVADLLSKIPKKKAAGGLPTA